jgi:antitoxin ParD1/3/4
MLTFHWVNDKERMMASSLNLSLTDELRSYVDSRSGDQGLYATLGEYIRDLIRRDMQDWEIIRDVVTGIGEAARGEFVPESILDIAREE